MEQDEILKYGSKTQEITIRAQIIRADGTVEDLGTVGYWHSNPLVRLGHTLKKKVGIR